jgi:acyl dehydratase
MGYASGAVLVALIIAPGDSRRSLSREIPMPPVVLETLHALNDFVGREIALTEWLTITQDRIDRFAEATEDRQWIHVDRERAQRESPFGTTIAHGFLTLSLLSHFMKQAIQFRGGVRMGINYGLNRVRFPSPVRADSQIRARISLQSLKELADALEAVFSVSLEVQGSEKPCCVAEWIVRYYAE